MKPTRADFLLTAILLLVAALVGGMLLLAIPHGEVAVVTIDGQETVRLPLNTETTLIVCDGYTVAVEEGKVYMKTAPCPDLICVHTPPISRTGETIVCLPGNVIITVEED